MFKKTWLILVASMIIIALSACGSSSSGGDPKSTGDAKSTSGEAKSDSSSGKVKLRVLSYETAGREDYEKVFQAFTKENPNIEIEMTISPTDQFPSILQTQIAASDGPDLFTLWPGVSYLYTYAKNGHLLDLTDQPWVKDINKSVKESYTYNGKVYGLPLTYDVVGVIYNKSQFQKLNLKTPESWEEFLELCEKIKVAGKFPIAMSAKDIWPSQFLPIYTLNNNVVYSKNRDFDNQLMQGKATFANSDYNKAFEMFLDLNQKGYFNPNPLGITYDQSNQMMLREEALMTVNGNWQLNDIQNLKPSFELGMFPVPAPKGYQTTVSVGSGSGLSAYAKTKHPEEVKKLLAYMTKPEVFKQIKAYNNRMAGLDTIKLEINPDIPNVMVKAAEKSSYPFTNLTWTKGIQDEFQKQIQLLLTNQTTIDKALATVDQVAKRSIEEYNKGN